MTQSVMLAQKSKKMEDLFFMKEDEALQRHKEALHKLKQTKEELSRASGIQDPAVLEKLVELKIRPETATALSIVPLVMVAWADGELDKKEKKEILRVVNAAKFMRSQINCEIIEQWLEIQPGKNLLEAWIHYVRSLSSKLPQDQRDNLKKEILDQAENIAKASGGFLGFGNKISAEEKKLLKTLAYAFDHKRSSDP
jgi:tellurite resistance protein